jgi:hypothetical protein
MENVLTTDKVRIQLKSEIILAILENKRSKI